MVNAKTASASASRRRAPACTSSRLIKGLHLCIGIAVGPRRRRSEERVEPGLTGIGLQRNRLPVDIAVVEASFLEGEKPLNHRGIVVVKPLLSSRDAGCLLGLNPA